MEWLNYHHLLYFWTVAREGSIAKARTSLRLAPSTISLQIRALEEALDEKLFERKGRRLVLTEIGTTVFEYADEIFGLGQELMTAVKQGEHRRPMRFVVGVASVVPKLIAYRLLEPALSLPEPVTIVCVEDTPERLVAQLATYSLDMVLTDNPIGSEVPVRSYNHLLGDCGLSFFAPKKMAERYRRKFPESLDGAPLLLPRGHTAVRRALDAWFQERGVRPLVVGEFDDTGLLKAFGASGVGLFSAPSVIEDEVRRQYSVTVIGRTTEVVERFYAISVERRLRHPAVVAISRGARDKLFD